MKTVTFEIRPILRLKWIGMSAMWNAIEFM